MFRHEFAPDAIDAGVEVAKTFGSVEGYLLRVLRDIDAELASIQQCSVSGSDYAKQFCPARAVEAYAAHAHATAHLTALYV